MGFQQDTIIYIEDQDKLDASVVANAFADKNVKNRAYVNTLGAELAMKYLASENIKVSDIYNIHSIKKILEELDISDVMLPNIHIDVRVIFDENAIFIPKSHFKYNLVPDIYLVLNLAKDYSHVKFLGFFEPKLINKNNQNEDYYFIEKEKLNPVSDLKNYIKNFNGNTANAISEQDIENSERIIMAMTDNDVSEDEKQYLIKQLTKSVELRDKFIEYENFETLSYKAMTDPQIEKKKLEEIENNSETTVENNVETDLNATIQDLEQTSDNLEILDNLESVPFEENTTDLSIENSESNTNLLDDNTDISSATINVIANTSDGMAASDLSTNAIAEEELLHLAEVSENIVDTTDNSLDIVNSDIEISKDLVNDKTETPESITFDNIDTSTFDDYATENYDDNFNNQETISFDNIDTSTAENTTDFIDQIDNKISFDDNITINNNNTTGIDESLQDVQNSLPFDDIDTSLINNSNTIPKIEDEQPILLDDIDTSNIVEDLNLYENNEDEPFDSIINPTIPEYETPNFEKDIPEDLVQSNDNFAEFTELEENEDSLNLHLDENLENDTEELNIEPPDIEQEDFQEGDNDNINFEFFNNETENESSELPETPIANTLMNEASEEETSPSNGFGKNLLGNINKEELNNISTDDLEFDETLTNQNAEEITSDELLSQIDNLLNIDDTSLQNQTTETDTSTIEETTNITSQSEDDLSEIPDIDSLVASQEFGKIPETPISTSQLETDFETEKEIEDTENISDETPINNTNSSSEEELIDTSLDELLNLPENNLEENTTNPNDKLEVLFNDTDPTSDTDIDDIASDNLKELTDETLKSIPGAAFIKQKNQTDKKTLITAAAVITILAGASAFIFLKPKAESTSDIESANSQTSQIINKSERIENNTENILETNAPTINKTDDKKVQKTKQQVKELKNTAIKKPISSESYLEVQRLVWDVPDNLSYNPKMQNYLRTAGKSIKLSLSADLLLASEYAYSNQVKVGLKISKDGNIQESNIISSSGSSEIDNIVLQSVKDTLNVVKPPSNEINTPDFNLNLIIYF